jgi:hypothetical protein
LEQSSGVPGYRSGLVDRAMLIAPVIPGMAESKEHATAGITLSMKNCFGITPATIYGTGFGRRRTF